MTIFISAAVRAPWESEFGAGNDATSEFQLGRCCVYDIDRWLLFRKVTRVRTVYVPALKDVSLEAFPV